MAAPPIGSMTPSYATTQSTQAPVATDKGAAADALKSRQKKFSLKGPPITDRDAHAKMMGQAMGAFSPGDDPEGSTSIADIGQAFADVRDERKLKEKALANEKYQAELMARLRALTAEDTA